MVAKLKLRKIDEKTSLEVKSAAEFDSTRENLSGLNTGKIDRF